MEEYLKVFVPTAISMLAAFFSYLTFRRNRTFENENYVYKIKYECYREVLGEINKVLNVLQDHLVEYKNYIKVKHNKSSPSLLMSEDDLEGNLLDKADKIDEILLGFDDVVIVNSLFIPKDVLNRLEIFSGKLIDSDLPIDDEGLDALGKFDSYISELIKEANEINKILRADLNVESLNVSLYRRIKN